MLLINLLPPELRKKRGGGDFNPIVLAVAASVLLALVPAGTWSWLTFVRIPAAKAQLLADQETLNTKTVEAAAVENLQTEIVAIEKHRDLVVGLLSQKVHWARTLDDFATALAGPWPGFEVSCTDLSISAAPVALAKPGDAKKATTVNTIIKGRYKLVGEEQDKSGDYVNTFFVGMEKSPFWTNHGIQDKADKTYKGDTPVWNPEIQRRMVDLSLDWQRTKIIATGAKPAPAKQGGN
jgi:hypothetical protein